MKDSVAVPTRPPTVTTNGSAIAPMHKELVDDDHISVEHSTDPRRPDGVESENAKFTPITDSVLVTCDAATFITAARVLTAGAVDIKMPIRISVTVDYRKLTEQGPARAMMPSKVKTRLDVPT